MGTNTSPFNLTGHPAISVNAGFVHEMPVGVMIVGKHFDDAVVLKVAQAVEKVRKIPDEIREKMERLRTTANNRTEK